jgi:hypothetical protein
LRSIAQANSYGWLIFRTIQPNFRVLGCEKQLALEGSRVEVDFDDLTGNGFLFSTHCIGGEPPKLPARRPELTRDLVTVELIAQEIVVVLAKDDEIPGAQPSVVLQVVDMVRFDISVPIIWSGPLK